MRLDPSWVQEKHGERSRDLIPASEVGLPFGSMIAEEGVLTPTLGPNFAIVGVDEFWNCIQRILPHGYG